MSDVPHIPESSKEPLTLRQHEQYVRESHPRLEGTSDERHNERVEERLGRLREDFERKDKRGTLYLMDAGAHRERAEELQVFAQEETNQEKSYYLLQAAQIHLHHARRLDAEAAEKEADAV